MALKELVAVEVNDKIIAACKTSELVNSGISTDEIDAVIENIESFVIDDSTSSASLCSYNNLIKYLLAWVELQFDIIGHLSGDPEKWKSLLALKNKYCSSKKTSAVRNLIFWMGKKKIASKILADANNNISTILSEWGN